MFNRKHPTKRHQNISYALFITRNPTLALCMALLLLQSLLTRAETFSPLSGTWQAIDNEYPRLTYNSTSNTFFLEARNEDIECKTLTTCPISVKGRAYDTFLEGPTTRYALSLYFDPQSWKPLHNETDFCKSLNARRYHYIPPFHYQSIELQYLNDSFIRYAYDQTYERCRPSHWTILQRLSNFTKPQASPAPQPVTPSQQDDSMTLVTDTTYSKLAITGAIAAPIAAVTIIGFFYARRIRISLPRPNAANDIEMGESLENQQYQAMP